MLEFKKIIENFDREKANNTAAQESNDKYEAAIAGEAQGNEAEGRSQIVIKSISGVLQKAIPVLAEPFLSTSKPIRIGGVRNLNQKAFAERFANNLFKEDMDSVEFMEKLIGGYLKQDIVWVHADWEALKIGEELVENRGKVTVLDSSNVFYDSAAETQRDLRFVAVREKVNKYKLKAEVESYGKMHDAKNLKNAMSGKNDNEVETNEREGTIVRNVRENDVTIIRYYGLDYNKKGKLVGFESAWVEGKKERLYTIPRDYPMDRLPFFYKTFFKDSNSLVGKSAVYFLLDNQKIQSGLARGILDNLENANNEKIFFDGRKVPTESLIAYKQNNTFIPFHDVSKMKFKGYNPLPQYVLNVKNEAEKDANELLGTSSRQGAGGSNKFTDDKANNQISISETLQVFSIRKLGKMVSDIVKTLMIYSEWYLTEEQKQSYLPEGMSTDVFDNMDKVKMLDQAGTASTKATVVRELSLLLQQSKENGKYIGELARKEIVADLADNLNRPLIADMIRATSTEPSAGEQVAAQQAQEMQSLELEKLKAELQQMKDKMDVEFMKAETERIRIEAEAKHKNRLADSTEQDTKNKSLDATKKTIDMMDGLENEGSQGLEQKQS